MPLITAAIAREFAARAAESRRRNYAARKQREAQAVRNALIATLPAPQQSPPSPQPPEKDKFLLARLSRVRKQLDRIDDMLLTEEDPQKLDRLASASMRLSEQERLLADRPLPGSRRPGTEAKAKRDGMSSVAATPPPPPPMPPPQVPGA